MPNSVAYLMLVLWPFVALLLFHRLKLERALIWSILGAYLILPPVANFNLPAVPDLDKFAIANLSAFAICTLVLGHRVPIWPASVLGKAALLLFVVSPFVTTLNNGEPLMFDIGAVQGLRLYDSVAAVANQMIAILPYFLARRFLATPEAMRELLVAMVVAMLFYSLPMLLEVRLSPQLNIWIYGFFQHEFQQMIRYGGFRPIVFFPHALWLAFFVMTAGMSALALARAEMAGPRTRWVVAALWLAVVLVLCKTAGPLAYAAAMVPAVLFLSRRQQLWLAAGLAAIVITYPFLRSAGLIPVEAILDWARSLDPERAASLQFRIDNETVLLQRAFEKPLFGWGGYGRGLIHSSADGHVLTIADGAWVIALGKYGWAGYVAEFSLLALPLFLLAWHGARQRHLMQLDHAGPVALILAINMVDMLPNAPLVPFTWLVAGAVLGLAEHFAVLNASPRKRAPARRLRSVL